MRKFLALLTLMVVVSNPAIAGWTGGGGAPPPGTSESVEPDYSETVSRPLGTLQPLRPTRPLFNIELTDEEMAEKLSGSLSNPIKPNPIQIDVNGRSMLFKPKTLDFNARKLILTAPTGEDVTLWKTEEATNLDN